MLNSKTMISLIKSIQLTDLTYMNTVFPETHYVEHQLGDG